MTRLLTVLVFSFLISCSTQPNSCDTYTLQEHNYYNGDGYSVFTNKSDSVAVFLEPNELSEYKEDNKYELCFDSGEVIIK